MVFDTHLLTLLVQAVPFVFVALFPVLNPIGSAIILLPYTSDIDETTRRLVAAKVARNTFILLTIVLLAGSYLLAFFGISVHVVQAAGGFVLASMGWKLLTADDQVDTVRPSGASNTLEEQTFYPFTFPVTVGPGSVAVTLTLSAHTTHPSLTETLVAQAGSILGFAALAVSVYLSLAYTVSLLHRVGPTGTKVTMRLMAFIILCIGAQISWTGLQALILQLR
jgi:multiple antibiotic resistance protein